MWVTLSFIMCLTAASLLTFFFKENMGKSVSPNSLLVLIGARLCMVITYSKSMDQPGKVANPACGQLNRENKFTPVPVRV